MSPEENEFWLNRVSDEWQTQANGSLDDEYQIYMSSVDDNGNDIAGQPYKSYDEWLNS